MAMERTLRLIRQAESAGDYDAMFGRIASADLPQNAPGFGKRLSELTVEQVLAYQDSIDARYPSEAAGAYQVMEDTLRELVERKKVSPQAAFDAANQDRIALILMRRRGLSRCASGRMDPADFCLELAKEWASLPVVRDIRKGGRTVPAGASYYAGDGLNKSLVSPEELLDAVTSDLGLASPPRIGAPVHRPAPAPDDQESLADWVRGAEAHAADLLGGSAGINKLIRRQLKARGSRTIKASGLGAALSGLIGGGAGLTWLGNLVPQDWESVARIVEVAREHGPLALGAAAFAALALFLRIAFFRADDVRTGKHTGR